MTKEDPKPEWKKTYEALEKKYGSNPQLAYSKPTWKPKYFKPEWGPEHDEAIRKFEEGGRKVIKTETKDDIIKFLFSPR